MIYKLFASVVMVAVLTGCGTIRQATMPPEDDLLSGAGAIIGTGDKVTKFEQIDITELLKTYGLDNLKDSSKDITLPKFTYLRNDMQDRILAASNQRCGYYLRMLVAAKSQTKMAWGGLALLLTGAASVTNPASAAKLLAAGSSVATGVNTLYDEAYFNNLALNVIAGGISKQREGLLLQMTEMRKKNMSDYPVNRAVADAISYHSACNMVTGLEAAANAIKLAPAAPTEGKPGTAPVTNREANGGDMPAPAQEPANAGAKQVLSKPATTPGVAPQI